MNTPLVSVVTPVYNGAEYLVECIESVLAQTYENWDYTIVDNASTDATAEIAARYAAKDARIRLLHFDELVDVTTNHNRAFEAISPESEFCKIVQADDFLYPECLSKMIEAAGVSDKVGVVSGYQLWDRRVHLHGLAHDTTLVSGRDVLRATLLGQYNVTGGPTATMLRSRIVRERRPFFEAGFRHEDSEAMLWILGRADLAFVHQILTYAREQPDARTRWSERMNSAGPEEIVFHLRYGRRVLSRREYRARLRTHLTRYLWWHLKQLPRLSRLRDPEFFELHSARQRLIVTEAEGDREVLAAMAIVGTFLSRGIGHTRQNSVRG